MNTKYLLIGAATIALCSSPGFAETASATGDQAAQPAPSATPTPAPPKAAPGTGTEEIVVTAQKVAQPLLRVPVAITAIQSKSLTTQNLNRLSDFYNQVPGLQYSSQRVSGLSLRGITTCGATSATVAVLVDDVQFGGTTGAGQPPLPDFDASVTDRIEVLRGPQGTLYGASSLGGLIKYVLRQPDTHHLSGRVEATGVSASEGGLGYALRGSINIPIANWAGVLLSGFTRDDPSYLDNFKTGKKDTNTRKVWGGRGALLITPTDDLSITLSALRQTQHAINSDLAVTSGGVPICIACTTGGTAASRATAYTTFEPVYGDLTINALDSTNRSQFSLYSGRVEWNLGPAKITSISAWSTSPNVLTNDVTTTFFFLPPIYAAPPGSTVQIANADRTNKFVQEVRANGTVGTFDWLVGAFYTNEHAETDQTLLLSDSSGALLHTPYVGAGPTVYREYAGFADLTWHPTSQLDVQVGARYSHNKQDNTAKTTIDGPAQAVFGPSSITTSHSSDNAFTWLFSPSYHFSRDIMVYFRAASGYRPGGPNADATGQPAFGPDRVVNYELGFKGIVVPGLLTIDTSLFQINWSNIQLQGTAPNQFTFITNGGRARSRGLEFAAHLIPWKGMAVDATLALTDAVLTQDLPVVGSSLVGKAGDRLPFTANVQGSISAEQSFFLSDRLRGSVGGSYVYVGDRPATFNVTTGTRPRILMPGYDLVNLNTGVTYANVWQATLFVRNLFDKRGVTTAQNRNGTNVPTALFVQPRTLGITLARNF